MTRSALPLFDGFIETPFERRFQGLLRQAWRARRWHVIVAEPGSGKTMGIGDLRDEASRVYATLIEGQDDPLCEPNLGASTKSAANDIRGPQAGAIIKKGATCR